MKKFLSKIALSIILMISISSSIMPVSFGEDTASVEEIKKATSGQDPFTEITTAITEIAQEHPCVTKEEKKQYLIITIEEPLLWGEENIDQKDYKTRTCYRNILDLSRLDGGTINTHLSNKCLTEIEAQKNKIRDEKEREKIKYLCEEVMVILSEGGSSFIMGYIATIYKWGATMAGLISVVVIIFSGIQISASGGESQAIESGKNRIVKSLAGLAVLFLSALLLYTINPTFFT